MADNINPAHYKFAGDYEPIRVIEDWQLGFKAGSALKYIARAGRKDGAPIREDLEKARWYLARLAKADSEHLAFRTRQVERLDRQWYTAREVLSPLLIYPTTTDVVNAWTLPQRLRDVVSKIAEGRWVGALYYLERYLEELPE